MGEVNLTTFNLFFYQKNSLANIYAWRLTKDLIEEYLTVKCNIFQIVSLITKQILT